MAMPIDGGIVLFSLLFLACRPVAAASGASRVIVGGGGISPKSILGGENLAPWANGLLKFSPVASAPAPDGKAPLVLARKRTKRPDMLNSLRMYRDGWDVTNKHYWASVGFTGAPGFILAFIWFVLFALALVTRRCCRWRIELDKEKLIFLRQMSLVLLLVFTCAALIGCVLLSVGQDEFHGEVMDTLNFVVNQSDFTVDIIRNVTDFLSLAKSISVDQLYLPYDVQNKIGKLNVDLNDAAHTLSGETAESSAKVRRVFDNIRFTLILVAAIMLLLAIIGFLLSVLGHKHAVYIFIITGWLLVAVTFILCGFFIIVSNAVGDACVAMGEWVHNSQAETSLSSILPCVDEQTTNLTLYQSKDVIVQLVGVVNTAIYSQATSVHYNQSGPLMPSLCSPYDSNLHDRQCKPEEVSLVNASTVWQNYTCAVSESGLCVTVGRVTPDIYQQLVAAVNVSYALDHYTPFLLSLQNCQFVKETFDAITTFFCPQLELDLRVVNAGLGLISTGVMLCLIFWFLYANRPQREEVFAKQYEIKTAVVNQTPTPSQTPS
ncbi:uncharacterized protein LOC121970451 [Zingiber officinale]|uniref:Uncharacterized protein n=1 Tax=Zingiber officinale TaxID=94328 RepID=A0A8J5HNQ9_ZINOF|nr:uncharacterized protein LOC121970451 [Zingiber officinale]KAG6532608.1 hypothetical protein ZIOFF_006457 [Zingiber officinale]